MRIFNEKKVKYLIVGGYAVMKYTEPRYTKDLDILIGKEKSNATIIFEALREFGAPLSNLSASDLEEEKTFYQIGVAPYRVQLSSGFVYSPEFYHDPFIFSSSMRVSD